MVNGTWENRRRTIFGALTFIAVGNTYCLYLPPNLVTPTQEAFVTLSLPVAASIIGAYVFGAAWDDKNMKP